MRPINLLPPEAEEKSAGKRASFLVGFLVIAVLAGLAFLSFWWLGKAQDAESDVASARQANQQLEAEIASLADAAELRRRYEDGVGVLSEVLANDVSFARLLNDVARLVPARVWMESMSVTASDPTEINPGAYGSLTVSGTAFDYSDAATWLRVLDADEWPAVGGGWVTQTTASEIEGFGVVNFASLASLTDASLSLRGDRIPEVAE